MKSELIHGSSSRAHERLSLVAARRKSMLRGAFAAARSAQIRNISSKFATALDIELVVASPEQDGVTPSARRTTTLFLVKDDHGDVHLAPYHYWNDSALAQPSLVAERADEPAADEALCVMGPGEG